MLIESVKLITAVNATADDWQLYDKEGRDEVAKELNTAFLSLFNLGKTRPQMIESMEPILEKYSEFGAADSEGYALLDQLLINAFK